MTPSPLCTSSSRSTRILRSGGVFSLEVLSDRSGILVFRALGPQVKEVFADEPGGHKWQRYPKNDKRGRVHTSTVTVAVMPETTKTDIQIDEKDLTWSTCRGSGKGGQHRNKTETAVILWHKPSGIQIRSESERSQYQNKQTALKMLEMKLSEREQMRASGAEAASRKTQVGLGQRGDKRRTVRVQDGQVNDHVTGKSWRLKDYLRGEW